MSALAPAVITAPVASPRLSRLAKANLGCAAFIGLGALAGVAMMWSTPERFGMGQLLEPMRQLPFGEALAAGFGWPGLALLWAIGVPHATAVWLIHQRHPFAARAVVASGVVLLLWILLQLLVLYGPNPLSNLYLVLAVVEIGLGTRWNRARRAA